MKENNSVAPSDRFLQLSFRKYSTEPLILLNHVSLLIRRTFTNADNFFHVSHTAAVA